MKRLVFPTLLFLVQTLFALDSTNVKRLEQWIVDEQIEGIESKEEVEILEPAKALSLPHGQSAHLSVVRNANSPIAPLCGQWFFLLEQGGLVQKFPLGDCWLLETYEEDSAMRYTFRLNSHSLPGKQLVSFEDLELHDLSYDENVGELKAFRRRLHLFSIYPWGAAQLLVGIPIGAGMAQGSELRNKCTLKYELKSNGLEIVPSPNTACKEFNKSAGHHPFATPTRSISRLDAILAKATKTFREKGASAAVAEIEPVVFVQDWIIDPAHVGAINDYGYFLEQAGRLEQAIFVLSQVVEQFPARTPAYLNLGDAYQKAGHTDKAKASYAKYVDLMEKSGKGSKVPARVRQALGA